MVTVREKILGLADHLLLVITHAQQHLDDITQHPAFCVNKQTCVSADGIDAQRSLLICVKYDILKH